MTSPRVHPLPAGSPQSAAKDLPDDYEEREYLLTGRAGTWSGRPTGAVARGDVELDYTTRLLVRCPRDPQRFSGRVVVEPFNTSSGADTDALFQRVGTLLTAQGDAWVGVSERASSQRELQRHDPLRYGDLQIPSNDLAWDVLAQVGRLLRDPEAGLLPGCAVRYAYLGGYSQSGADTAAFAVAIHAKLEGRVYDGYFPAAHSASITALASGDAALPGFESAPKGAVDVPVIDLETQTDVEGFVTTVGPGRTYTSVGGAYVRRDDSDEPTDRYRLYEVAGAPHAAFRPGCEGSGSRFPVGSFLRAALSLLFAWAESGSTPPRQGRLVLDTLGEVSSVRLDEHGNAIGGVRSPWVDVPLARYEAHAGDGVCALVGRETPLSEDLLRERYGNLAGYTTRMSASLDATVDAGFLLAVEREALRAGLVGQARPAFTTMLG